ncbi:MAG: hypothetical protein AB7D57_13300 [Desulfovibrionaceae bacterium]
MIITGQYTPLQDSSLVAQTAASASNPRTDADAKTAPRAAAGDQVEVSDEAAELAANAAGTTAAPDEEGPQYAMLNAWGAMTRSDGAKVTVGDGSITEGDTTRAATLVMIERNGADPEYIELGGADAYRLLRNESGGYDVANGLDGGEGDELFVGRDLSGMTLSGGDGENGVFSMQANRLNYTGGAGRDVVLVNTLRNSRLDLGAGDDRVKGGAITNTKVDLGAGNDGLQAYDYEGGEIIGGQGNDTVKANLTDADVSMGDGADKVSGYDLVGNRINLGAGDDSLSFYSLRDSQVNTGADPDVDPDADEAAGGTGAERDNDHISGYQILGGQVTTGAGNDSFDLYEIDGSIVDTGDGNDRFKLYEIQRSTVNSGQGDDRFNVYNIEESQVDTGDGNDTIRSYVVQRSSTDMGAGNDTLSAYDILDSSIVTDPLDDPLNGGDDTIGAYRIWGSSIQMGGGDDLVVTRLLLNSHIVAGTDAGDEDDEAAQRPDATATSDRDTVRVGLAVDSSIATGADNDHIDVGSARELTVGAGDGQDTLSVRDADSRILANHELENVRRKDSGGTTGFGGLVRQGNGYRPIENDPYFTSDGDRWNGPHDWLIPDIDI